MTRSRVLLAGLFGAILTCAWPCVGAVRYVDANAVGANNGSSWPDAYLELQSALVVAGAGDEIWVAAGTYKPDYNVGTGTHTGDRAATFQLKTGVAIYGGFPSGGGAWEDRDPATNVTILSGDLASNDLPPFYYRTDNTYQVVTSGYADATAIVDGFTIKGGSAYGTSFRQFGGGMYISGGGPTIANNTITGNVACLGAGIYIDGSSPTISNNTIADNTAQGADGDNPNEERGFGGGIYCAGGGPVITGNVITDNEALGYQWQDPEEFGAYEFDAPGKGGGICVHAGSASIEDNTITNNIAGFGGAIFCASSSTTITNNTITGNYAEYGGGGVYCDSSSPAITNNAITRNGVPYGDGGAIGCTSSSPTILNNTLTDNTAYNGGGIWCYSSSPTIANNRIIANSADDEGGGIYCKLSSPTMLNNTLTDNNAASGGALYVFGWSSAPTMANTIIAFNASGIYIQSGSGSPVLRCNCVYGNAAYNYSGITDPTGTDANISVDPKLAGVDYGNVHIQPDSPCKNTGNNADAYGDFDMDAQARIQPPGGTVDIGADESDGTVWPAGPYVIVRVSPNGDDDNDGSSWELPKRTVQAGIDAASAEGGEVWVQAGTYTKSWLGLRSYARVYGGFAGNETAKDQRDWAANVTILDAQQAGAVVGASTNGYAATTTVDGFTITNASGNGIGWDHSSPTIVNNTITGNAGNGIKLLLLLVVDRKQHDHP